MSSDQEIVSSLKQMEFDFEAVKCMADILGELLETSIGTTSRYDKYNRVQITEEEIGRLSFAWNDVRNRTDKLKRDFMSRLYPREVDQ